MGCSDGESSSPDENQGGRRLVSETPQSLEPPVCSGQTSGDLGWECSPFPRPHTQVGHKNHVHCRGGGGVYTGAEAPELMAGHRELTEEQGTIPVAPQGPGAGWRAALSPTVTVPQGTWAAQVGRRSEWPGTPVQAPSLISLQARAGEASTPTLQGL